jgi:hypothetical protein
MTTARRFAPAAPRFATAFLLLALPALAGAQATPAKTTRFDVTNQFPFDIATALAPAPLPSPVNATLLAGALFRARPAVLECLVAPNARGPAARTLARADVRVDRQGLHIDVGGDNLTPAGRACVQSSLRRQLPVQPLPVDAGPVQQRLEVEHLRAEHPSVRLGVNVASDFAAAARLAMPGWGECFAPWRDRVPPPVAFTIALTKAGAFRADDLAVPFAARPLAACLRKRLAALPRRTGELDTLSFPLRLWFFNGAASAGAAQLDPQLRMFQFDARRDRLAGEIAVARGARTVPATRYDGLVKRYKAAPSPDQAPALFATCGALVQASDAWVARAQEQVALNRELNTLAKSLAVTDPAWNGVINQTDVALRTMEGDLAGARHQRDADKAACPRPKG